MTTELDEATRGEPDQGTGQDLPAVKPAVTPRKLQYLPAFRYVFEHPDWVLTLVFASVCSFIPVLGQIVLYGYYYEIVEGLVRHPGQLYPKFDFNRFADYCTRGVWVYVLWLMMQVFLQFFVQLPLQLLFQFGMLFVLRNQQTGVIVLSIAVPLVLIFVGLLLLAVFVLMTPFLLRAGLTQEFPLIFKFPWVKDWLKKMWLDTTLATLLVMVTAPVVLAAGCLLMGIGIFPAAVLLGMLSAHLSSQLYIIFLERGGEPIPLRPLPAEVPPAPVAPESSPFVTPP